MTPESVNADKRHPRCDTVVRRRTLATRGYALNAMCFSFNEKVNRDAFLADEEGYCARFHLTPEQRKAVADRNVLAMLDAGGQRLLSCQTGGNFRPWRAGSGRAANRYVG